MSQKTAHEKKYFIEKDHQNSKIGTQNGLSPGSCERFVIEIARSLAPQKKTF